ncbi:hypothetical protein WICPIJ_007095 [Wickerhamomyces pijperi]|uniref:Uncharacterized protein n=1 Tax=Wickerhamomyces pijperi TaxID=599730 RepID=A0A9P8TJK3_WICPI|nr:hypothetical protein WICPIJ_007095 [Wickerhamomyces pijperi]
MIDLKFKMGFKATSLEQTNESITSLSDKITSQELPEIVSDLLAKTNTKVPEGVSLLDLKNDSMLSYINNLALVVLSRIEAMKTNNSSDINKIKDQAVQSSIVQRVTIEKGLKNLEKKLSYQLEKMVRNYHKMDKDSSEDTINKKLEAKEAQAEDEKDSDEDSEAEDELSYKPDASAFAKVTKPDRNPRKLKASSKDSTSTEKGEKYKAPKIAAALPPTEFKDQVQRRNNRSSKLSSMEEYLQETGDAPLVTSSVGSNILDHGRGGVQTEKQRRKEQEIKKFEESNFTRISSAVAKKQEGKRKFKDAFFGEDWGIFNNKDNAGDDSQMNTKRSKPKTAWERAKTEKIKLDDLIAGSQMIIPNYFEILLTSIFKDFLKLMLRNRNESDKRKVLFF